MRNNLISRPQLRFYLKNQNMEFGDFLVDKKVLNRRSLNNILKLRENSKQKIGDIILQQNILSEERLKELFVEYYTRRKGLFLAESKENKDNNENSSSWVENILVS